MEWSLDEWKVTFEPPSAHLTCTHTASGACAEGTLAFTWFNGDERERWAIVPPRDSVQTRLALQDKNKDIQGYLTFTASGGNLEATVIHRAAQSFHGELTFAGTATLGSDTFACRTQPLAGSRVVQMAAGLVDSALNDSIFDIESDTALRFGGASVSLASQAPVGDAAPVFELRLSALPHEASRAFFSLDVIRDYYKARYVPYYTPINKERCPSPPTGWMSWNTYFDTAGEMENLAEARVAVEHLKPFGLEIWHIESWQDDSGELPVSKFHNLTLRPFAEQFPHGMKWLADEIRKLGFKPGIWTVPFGTGDQAYYEEHKDWFLHDAEGNPMRNWCGKFVLDPSQEAVRQHMEESHRVMSEDWGYEYFKIDGMSGRHASYSAHFYERPSVRAAFKEPCEDPFRLCVEALRRGIGPDRIWLACQGHYTGPEIGLADAGRLGADIVSHRKPPDWHNYRHQAETVLNQLFVHNIVWFGDPDTLLVAEPASVDTVRLATAVVGLPGQMMFAGDKLAELPPDRMRLLQQCLPVCDVRPLDLFPIFDMRPVWDLKVRRDFASWDVVSLFNWGDEVEQAPCSFEELGLAGGGEYLVYDFWNQRLLGRFSNEFALDVPARGNRLLAIHPVQDHPQFLSTNRHVTQGAVSLDSLAWDPAAKALSGVSRVVGGFPDRLTFYAPPGMVLAAANQEGVGAVETECFEDGTLTMVLNQAASGLVKWRLAFE